MGVRGEPLAERERGGGDGWPPPEVPRTLTEVTASDIETLPGWGATWTQATGSANVTATNLDWNRILAPTPR